MGELGRFLKKLQLDSEKRRRAMAVLCALSLVVASGVSWALRIVGITMADVPSCGIPEHSHTQECYQSVLICGLEEGALPETQAQTEAPPATEAVLAEGETGEAPVPPETQPPHVHTDACYRQELICPLEEHIHTLMCYSDPQADVETPDVWKGTLPVLGEDWSANVAAVAASQLGYGESQRNYNLAEDGVTKQGYTRYGDWYGNPYGSWNAMFASFCLHYAGVPEGKLPWGSGAYAWAAALEGAGMLTRSLPETLAGTLVFYDRDGDGSFDRVGIARSGSESGLTLIEGDVDGWVAETSVNPAGAAFCPIPSQSREEPPRPQPPP